MGINELRMQPDYMRVLSLSQQRCCDNLYKGEKEIILTTTTLSSSSTTTTVPTTILSNHVLKNPIYNQFVVHEAKNKFVRYVCIGIKNKQQHNCF